MEQYIKRWANHNELLSDMSVKSSVLSPSILTIQDDRYILMQYTWIKDKNWKEIYEGDIIKKDNDWDWVLRVVWYSKYEYVLYEKEQLKSWKRQDWRIFDMSSIIWSTQVYGEVIWNIYENPGILSSTQIKNV